MGADATGFLAVMGSCSNQFVRNTSRMSGDGFFLAGLSPQGNLCGCDDNTFVENDASLSPNIGFEATFCRGNVYRGNFADRCNYGFWCGYSREFLLEGNRVLFNRQAGIAVENGVDFKVENNQFQANGHGILLWSRYSEEFLAQCAGQETSSRWNIVGNTFARNGIGIRIAADQDHGIRPADGTKTPRPHSHLIEGNDIQENRVGIQLACSDKNTIRGNTINGNVEANLRLDDSNDNTIENNIGLRGAYL
jgi:parallel beta-helix repeat protein